MPEEYYYEWRKIGESADKKNNFSIFWEPSLMEGTKTLITAVAYSDRGRKSIPSPGGEAQVIITAGAECIEE